VAFAGVIFPVLMIGSVGIIRVAVPADPTKLGIWLTDHSRRNAVVFGL
jgi:hypothetical protein